MMTANRIRPQLMPWRLFDQVQEDFQRELSDWFGAAGRGLDASLGIWTRDEAALVAMELPARQPEDIDVSVHGNVITIEAKAPTEPELPQGARLLRRERTAERVRRQLQLPFEIDPGSVEASYERGLLVVRLNAHESAQPAKIEVKAG